MANYKNSPTVMLDDDGDVSVNRNWHDRYQENSTSMPVGRVIPLLCEFLQGNTKVKLDIDSAVQTNPTASPVFGRMSVDLQTIYAPLRLYVVGLYGNNLLENDVVDQIAFPLTRFGGRSLDSTETINQQFVGQGSLLAHLRYPRHFMATALERATDLIASVSVPLNPKARPASIVSDNYENAATGDTSASFPYLPPQDFNAVPILAYIDSCLHYYADPFDREIPFERTIVNYTREGEDIVVTFDRTIIPVAYEGLLNLIYEAKGFSIPDEGINLYDNRIDVSSLTLVGSPDVARIDELNLLPLATNDGDGITYFENEDLDVLDVLAMHVFNDGLFPATFKPDRFTTWYDDDQVLKLSSKTTFEGGSYTAMRLAQAEYNRLAAGLIKGQTYDDHLNVTYGSDFKTNDAPIRIAIDSYDIRFNDIVNTAAQSGQGEVPLGTPVARGYANGTTDKTIQFTTLEPGYLFVLGSLVPTVKYTEDVPTHLRYTKLGDTPNRFFDGAGFQNLLVGEAFNTGTSLDSMSIGSQPFYTENMVNYDRVSGLLATPGYESYNFIRDFDLSGFEWSSRGNDWSELANRFADNFRSKYVNGSLFDYAFPANAPVRLDEQYQAILSATVQNYFFVFRFDLRTLEPLTNQVLARATF